MNGVAPTHTGTWLRCRSSRSVDSEVRRGVKLKNKIKFKKTNLFQKRSQECCHVPVITDRQALASQLEGCSGCNVQAKTEEKTYIARNQLPIAF